MVQKVRGKILLPNVESIEDAKLTPATGIAYTDKPRYVRHARFKLTAVEIEIAAADDFGYTKVCDLAASNMMILGVNVDLAATVAGCAVNTAEAVDAAVGTTLTASTDFSNAGEDNLMEKVDGVGAAATGTIKGAGASDGGLGPVVFAAGSKAIYLNVSSAVTADTGTVTVTGYVDVYYIDLDDHS